MADFPANCPVDGGEYFYDEFTSLDTSSWTFDADAAIEDDALAIPNSVNANVAENSLLISLPNLVSTEDYIDVQAQFTVTGAFGVNPTSQIGFSTANTIVAGISLGGFTFGLISHQFDFVYKYGGYIIGSLDFDPPKDISEYGWSFTIRVRIYKDSYEAFMDGVSASSGVLTEDNYASGVTLTIYQNNFQLDGVSYPGVRCDYFYLYGPSVTGLPCLGDTVPTPPFIRSLSHIPERSPLIKKVRRF